MPKHARTDDADMRRDDTAEEEYPDALASLEPVIDDVSVFGQDSPDATDFPPVANTHKGKHGQTSLSPAMTEQQKKSRRMRRVLTVVVILLILLIGALVWFSWTLYEAARSSATQYTLQQAAQNDTESIKSEDTQDASTETLKKTEVPNLVGVIGQTQDTAMVSIGRGATVTGAIGASDETNPIRQSVTVALADEPSDKRLGTPTVYLGLDVEGKVIMAGYSVATASLGYGSLSFVDAVVEKKIIENTLAEAGVSVAEGSVVLPSDKTAYSTYDTDGKTLVQEKYSFSGAADIAGQQCTWSSVLVYDYKLANASGNLADTIRQIYVYIETPASAATNAAEESAAEGTAGALA